MSYMYKTSFIDYRQHILIPSILAITTNHYYFSFTLYVVSSYNSFLFSHPLCTAMADSKVLPPEKPISLSPGGQGVLSSIVASYKPYVELTRLNKPIGILYLYLPSLTSTLVAASLARPTMAIGHLLKVNVLLFLSAAMMRGAGCSWNDTLDQDLDRQVSRTRLRPIARGAISTFAAHLCTVCQLLVFFYLQTQLPTPMPHISTTSCFYVSIPFIIATGLYPLAKRVTNYPQVFLSIPMSWGIAIAFPALGLDLFASSTFIVAAGSLFLSNIAWVVLYDMIYAFQDIKDDIKAGILSMAVRHEKHPKFVLSLLSLTQTAFLLITTFLMGAGFVCFVGMLGTMTVLSFMVNKVDLGEPASCGWWFKYGCLLVSGPTVCGFLSEYLMRVTGSL